MIPPIPSLARTTRYPSSPHFDHLGYALQQLLHLETFYYYQLCHSIPRLADVRFLQVPFKLLQFLYQSGPPSSELHSPLTQGTANYQVQILQIQGDRASGQVNINRDG